ncbi:MAG: response regulator [Candidatus Woesearchaeota archaeon]|jgi:CheY-like chemotaxis protein
MTTVLIIDDERSIRTILERILTKDGHTVVTAADGKEGLERLLNQPIPDIILVDYNMPNVNGGQFLTTIMTQPQYEGYRTIPVIAIGDFPSESLYLTERLPKPISAEPLKQMVRKYCPSNP